MCREDLRYQHCYSERKMTQKKPLKQVELVLVPLPLILLENHPHDNINMDFLFVNSKPYLHTKSSKIKLLSIQACKGRGCKEMECGIAKVIKHFTDRGFTINGFHSNNKFETLQDYLSPYPLRIIAPDEHVGMIERSSRTVKERTRCTCQNLPYLKMPKIIVDNILELVIFMLNVFPAKDSVSKTLGPASIVLRTPKIDCNHLKLEFGSYVQAHINSTNTMKARSVVIIALRLSTGQDGYFFMSLVTDKRIHAWRWHQLPIPDLVIEQVHELAEREGVPNFINGYPIFEYMPGVPVDNDQVDEELEDNEEAREDNGEYEYDSEEEDEDKNNDNDEDDDDNDDDNDDKSDDNDDSDDNKSDDKNFKDKDDDQNDLNNNKNEDDNEIDIVEDPVANLDVVEENDNAGAPDEEVQHIDNVHGETEEARSADEKTEEARSTRQCPQRSKCAKTRKDYVPSFDGKSYAQMFQQVQCNNKIDIGDMYKKAVNVMSAQVDESNTGPGGTGGPQMSAKKAIETYRERAVATIFKEYFQLHEISVLRSTNPDKLTPLEKKDLLRAVNLIKEKLCGKIKGRTCADGQKQRKYISQEEATLPTVLLRPY